MRREDEQDRKEAALKKHQIALSKTQREFKHRETLNNPNPNPNPNPN
jgi:hypothetical protein